MDFTTTQLQAIKQAIITDQTILDSFNAGNHGIAIDLLNAPSSFIVWRTFTLSSDIQNAISWTNLTPVNPTGTSTIVDSNFLLACQGKQFNLQLLLQGNGFSTVATGKANIRAGFQDCLTAIPSGTAGALKSGGWPAVQLAMQRPATVAEKSMATGVGTSVSPGILTWEGTLPYTGILNDAMGS